MTRDVDAFDAYLEATQDEEVMRRLPGCADLVEDPDLADYRRSSGQWSNFCQSISEHRFACE